MKRVWIVLPLLAVLIFGGSATTTFGEGADKVIVVHNVKELMATEISTKKGHVTVLIEDGEYILSKPLVLTGTDITYKSRSGNRDDVVLRGDFKVSQIFSITNDRVTIADLSIAETKNNGIQVFSEKDADKTTISNVRFFDMMQQMIKASGGKSEVYSNDCIVEDCLFEFTAEAPDQVGTGGVDVQKGNGWIVRNNIFRNITNPETGLTVGAIRFWNASRNTLIESNVITNCDRGILLGTDKTFHYGGVVRNNTVHTNREVGIALTNADGTKVYHNTVYVDTDYPNAIEYRFAGTKDVDIANNLTNKAIVSRNGGKAFLNKNITDATADWFRSVEDGDLHLNGSRDVVVDKAKDLEAVQTDMDGEPRPFGRRDIGADELDEMNLYADPDTIKQIPLPSNKADETVVPSPSPSSSSGSGAANDLYAKQVTNVQLQHRNGQTFITWKELSKPVLNATISMKELYALKKKQPAKVTYQIYCSPMPIDSVEGLQPIGTVNALSGWNFDLYGIDSDKKDKPAFRYVIKEGQPALANGTGLWVNNPDENGLAYYAVTSKVNGVENRWISTSNAPVSPVAETVGQGVPVLQRIIRPAVFQEIKGATLYYYTRWEAPPNCSIKGKPMDYLVAVPPKKLSSAPVGIHMHCWGGSLEGGYGWWNDAEDGAIMLAGNALPYDWWTGYNEKLLSIKQPMAQQDWESGVVHPYATNRLFSFLDWMKTQPASMWSIDPTRTFTAGSSMGGSGSVMAGVRLGDQIAWTRGWVGVHTPAASPTYRSAYEAVYGKPAYNVNFEDGTKVWDYYDDNWFLRQYPEKETAFITFSNGKNDNAIGWKQSVQFYQALQDTKRPHLFIWGQDGHNQRTMMPLNGSERVMPIDIRIDQSLPAFTKCSLDDIPGNGDPANGDAKGQINAYLYWETQSIADTPFRWGMTMCLTSKAPKSTCTVDVTPRRLQEFFALPGEVLNWTNTDLATGKIIQSGTVTADINGIMTLPRMTVSKSKNRIEVFR